MFAGIFSALARHLARGLTKTRPDGAASGTGAGGASATVAKARSVATGSALPIAAAGPGADAALSISSGISSSGAPMRAMSAFTGTVSPSAARIFRTVPS